MLVGLALMSAALISSQYYKRKKLLIFSIGSFIFLALITLVSTPVVQRVRTFERREKSPNLAARMAVWGGVINMIEKYPSFGTGPGTFATAFTQYKPPGQTARYFYAHNDYLHFISETGLILIPIIIWMILALYRKGFNKLKNPSVLSAAQHSAP